ncbi:MAG: hypothetical protein IJ227_03715, partial [Mogibacterium sp.]|nr:hypothetical protein [Mogibacterium sp.]
AVSAYILLHACILTLRGITVLYSGEEIGELNAYSYHDDPGRWADSRNLHRGKMDWKAAEDRYNADSATGMVFKGIRQLMMIRKYNTIFHSDANVYVVETGDNRVLGITREYDGRRMLGLFNFSPDFVKTEIVSSERIDMTSPEREYIKGDGPMSEYVIEPYGFRWLLETERHHKPSSRGTKKKSFMKGARKYSDNRGR